MEKNGILKIISGIALMIAGALGLVFGKKIKTRILRIIILIISMLSIGSGFYLFVDGVEDLAIGRMDQYKLDSTDAQEMKFKDKAELELSLSPLREQQNSLRRLKYKCPDGSKEFTVYITHLGSFGLPKHSIVCSDGFALLTYESEEK